jgi:ABC-type branched-subunit amino acid transport system permease subunit
MLVGYVLGGGGAPAGARPPGDPNDGPAMLGVFLMFAGAAVGALVLMLFLEGSRFLRDILPGISEVDMASVRIGVVGLLLIAFVMFRPQGLMGDYTKQ